MTDDLSPTPTPDDPAGGPRPPRRRGRTAAFAVTSVTCAVTLVAGLAASGSAVAAADSGASGAPSAVSVGSDAGSRERAFAAASREFGVPRTVLEAVSYAQTRWDFHPGHSTTGGYGPMHLVDAALGSPAEGKGLGTLGTLGTATTTATAGADGTASGDARLADTLGRAARLTGLTKDALRTDELANIRGGAALLADTQRRLGHPTGATSDAGQWYAAVADASGTGDRAAAEGFADDAYAVIASGASRQTVDGKRLGLLPAKVTPQRGQLAGLKLRAGATNGPVDCPKALDCEWIPAPYEKTGEGAGDYGNHDLANRPKAPKITNIVIHNTEASYDTTLQLVTDPTYLAWNYTLRSSDGHVAQHLAPQDVGWHAGNWYVNMHSIGLEHEGYAATGALWFSEPMYRSSARLVKYLARKYDIPLDMQHVFGHDQIPGVTPANVPTMHWDPGPYWDWEHYFQLLGAPLRQTSAADRKATDLVRILPRYESNKQPVTGCETTSSPCAPLGTNFVYLRSDASPTAPLVNDVGLKPDGSPATTQVSDIGARAQAGLEFAVAERRGDWTAIWFNGVKGWFWNPRSAPTALPVKGKYVTPKAGLASAPVYGRAYPEASAYPAGIPVQALAPLQYTVAAGQRYAVGDLTVPTDYYRATTFSTDTPDDHVDVVGGDRYYQISLGHRFAFVRAADVDVVRAK
ncbi:N-acetylmuramoyl-L-alanine amidase [Terracoccus luteus]|uniref:N-acetylmuramoyl-L-alanine amidase n=1 Tax=Terracoccus luteus TaxID=53356 RepID=A0A495Y3I4_9MICO|nr:N-acetylmuramoyl-L-alanine amidase [Terracoccus luteus]RKT79826.1 N-acetylmuramoyl-L-alanine amidase [Terracoccus luteus]